MSQKPTFDTPNLIYGKHNNGISSKLRQLALKYLNSDQKYSHKTNFYFAMPVEIEMLLEVVYQYF